MKPILFVLLFCFLSGCHAQQFYVGTYTDGESQGIYQYELGAKGELKQKGLVAQSENPSFLAIDGGGKYLVAVNEIDRNNTGTVESYRITQSGLELVNRSTSGGAHPCFVAINEEGYVLTANYTGGNVGLLQLNAEGELSPLLDLQQHRGQGTTERQEGPHAHSAWFAPTGNQVIAVDLGTNQLWFSQLDPDRQKLIPDDPQTLAMQAGAGPRHLAFHPNGKWIYVVNELDGSVALVEKTGQNGYLIRSRISTLPEGYREPNTCADIRVSPDGKFVYASNRGHNSIAMFQVEEEGGLKMLGHESTQGAWPRNFSLSPDGNFLLVANQHSNNIVAFSRDKITGGLEYAGQIDAPTPVCILFAPN